MILIIFSQKAITLTITPLFLCFISDVITYEAGFLILDIPFVPELSDPNSLLFLQLAEDIQFQVSGFLAKNDIKQSCNF